MSEFYVKNRMGWLPDLPDFRDYTPRHEKVAPLLAGTAVVKRGARTPPPKADLRTWCSPIENQGRLGSCTAHAAVGMVEYFERRAFGKHLDASRLFLYKATRNILNWTGDTGAYLRSTMAALTLFGVPPEEYWPYDVAEFDTEPTAFNYAFAQNYKAIEYVSLDPPGVGGDALLAQIKTYLAGGFTAMFGFTVYNSISQADADGKIPFPCPKDTAEGGHAVLAVGYDNDVVIENRNCKEKTKGALLIRNSWGEGWGEQGYGWLPYRYVLEALAVDWWTLIKAEWIDTGRFKT